MAGVTLRPFAITNQTDSVIPAAATGAQSKLFGGITVTGGAVATVVIMRDGTTSGAAEVFRVQAGIQTTVSFTPAELVLFQTGIFCDVDANTLSACVLYG